MNYVEKWIKEKCSKCKKKKKCEPYSVEMLLCILQHRNKFIRKEEKEEKNVIEVKT